MREGGTWRSCGHPLGVALLWAISLSTTAAGTPEQVGYEDRLVRAALAQRAQVVDPSPEGKIVEAIVIAAENIVAPSDPYPRLLNLVHVRTRDRVIRREVMLEVGAPYNAEAAAESERNLRRLFILAVAKVVPVAGSAPDRVVALVVTKDLWSIRLNSEFSLAQGTLLQYLRIRPTEQNFLGMNHQLSLDFEQRLDTYGFGQIFTAQRALGTTWTVSESARAIINRQTLALEGSSGQVLALEPLTSLRDTSSTVARVVWDVRRRRVYRGAEVWQLPYPDDEAPTGSVPFVYDVRSVGAELGHSRSFGRAVKLELGGALTGYSRQYAAAAESNLTPDQQVWFACNGLPRSERAVLLVGSARVFTPRYQVLRDVETFGLSEDFLLGPVLRAVVRLSEPLLLSPQRFVEAGVNASYRAYAHDDLLTLSAAAGTRITERNPGCGLSGPFVNTRMAAELYNVFPRLWIGRFAFRALVELRFNDLSRSPVALGGGNGLRGTYAEELVGSHLALFNLEYRTRPVELMTLHAGLVAFVDSGAAFPESEWVTTVGLGLRLLFPQFDRETLRIDFGYVIGRSDRPWYRSMSATFGQVTDLRPDTLNDPI